MAEKNFMSTANQSAAETARLSRNSIVQQGNESAAETNRLANNSIVKKGNEFSAETERLSRSGSLAVKPVTDQTDAETKRLNSYSFKENNAVTNDDLENIEFQFQSNILDNYDVVTYHLKLFMVPLDASASGKVLDPSNQTVIAETGVTDMTIDNLEIRSVASINLESGTGTATSMTFEITEPSGATLIDRIYYQSLALGIGNWSITPFYMQISFRTRDPDTSASLDDVTGSIDNLSWLYPIKIGNITANVTTAGTKYSCSATIYNEVAQTNIISSIQQPIRLSNLGTFQDAMTDLENQLNSDQLYKLIGTYSIPDSFKIIVDPEIANYRITPPTNNQNSVRNSNYQEFVGKDATFPVGTSIDKIIDALLSNTQEFKESAIGAPTSGQEGSPAGQQRNQMRDIWRIYTETRPIAYDVRRLDNAKEFTIFVYKYEIGILEQNSTQLLNGPNTKQAMRKRLATYIKKGVLRKRYDYIFTGLNDQVINFDLNMNCAFAVGKARLSGAYSNLAMADKGVVNQRNSRDEADVNKMLAQTISFLNNAPPGQARDTTIKQTVDSIKNSDLDNDTKQRYLKILDAAKSPNKLTSVQTVQTGGGINNDGSSSQFSKTNLATRRNYTATDPNTPFFLSDVSLATSDLREMLAKELQYTKGKLRPTVFVEMLQDKAVGAGVESDADSGIQKLSSMFSVALHGEYGGTLQSAKITVKGDPFWLFPYPFKGNDLELFNSQKTKEDAFAWLKTNHKRVSTANLAGTDNFFALRFRSPRYYNQTDNDYDDDSLIDSDTFSGIYKLTTVTNRFHNGKFEQDLMSVIDPELKMSDFQKEIENSVLNTGITQPDDLLAQFPAAAQKTDRIVSNEFSAETNRLTRSGSSTIDSVNQTAAETKRLASNVPSPLSTLAGLPPRYI